MLVFRLNESEAEVVLDIPRSGLLCLFRSIICEVALLESNVTFRQGLVHSADEYPGF